ncbi:MAG: pH regulation protein F [Rhodospirillaceae bacterium]|nr:pH regulation protein F [Rhodospirillales bacterium]MBT3905060.1 pH regulation protein F [Rhodospirillaceae bacterium]MBT4703084.1 pH regulation protein F [Rhodospirillaceae bacterium]MBT5034213.1 pH regulation protein F [Rhodospirillaceae bacterium]MBT6220628.1 pH regulation protein F [Rhodospirillaceae bacterium]
MYSLTTAALLFVMFLTIIRALKGPTVYDRILAVNSFGTLTVAMIAVHGFLADRPEFLDIAMLYALINFIGTIAAVKYVKFNNLGFPTSDEQKDM